MNLYTDGGVCLKNPSPWGGSWAWRAVNPEGPFAFGSGHFRPTELGLQVVGNNLAELVAAVEALEFAPVGWDGVLYTDSLITKLRVESMQPLGKSCKMNGVTESVAVRLREVVKRLGAFTVVLIAGHPTKKELTEGFSVDGLPTSYHNVWCDQQCKLESLLLVPGEVEIIAQE